MLKDLPSEQELENLFTKVSQKEIKPYEFELNQVELINKDLTGSKIVKRKRFPRTDITKLTLQNGAEVFLKKTDFQKDKIRLRAFSLGGYSTASLDKIASAKYTEDILV